MPAVPVLSPQHVWMRYADMVRCKIFYIKFAIISFYLTKCWSESFQMTTSYGQMSLQQTVTHCGVLFNVCGKVCLLLEKSSLSSEGREQVCSPEVEHLRLRYLQFSQFTNSIFCFCFALPKKKLAFILIVFFHSFFCLAVFFWLPAPTRSRVPEFPRDFGSHRTRGIPIPLQSFSIGSVND